MVMVPGFGELDFKTKRPAVELGPLQKEWLEALKSGKYLKGLGTLESTRPEGMFCCLGVACSIFRERFGIERTVSVLDSVRYDGCIGSMEKAYKLGLRNGVGHIADCAYASGESASLAGVNDGAQTFEPIIWLIENYSGNIFKESL